MTNYKLQFLRAEIDEIDAQIVNLLASRFRITSKIGKIKALNALDAVDPKREAAQEERFRELAQHNDLNPDLVIRLFRSIINEVVRNHRVA